MCYYPSLIIHHMLLPIPDYTPYVTTHPWLYTMCYYPSLIIHHMLLPIPDYTPTRSSPVRQRTASPWGRSYTWHWGGRSPAAAVGPCSAVCTQNKGSRWYRHPLGTSLIITMGYTVYIEILVRISLTLSSRIVSLPKFNYNSIFPNSKHRNTTIQALLFLKIFKLNY